MPLPQPSVTVAITAVPERRPQVLAIRAALQPLPVAVWWDAHHVGPWPTFAKAVQEAATGALGKHTHLLTVQDDVQPCTGFLVALEAILGVHPGAVLGLYYQRRHTLDALARGLRWVDAPGLAQGVANVIPVGLALDFMRWATERTVTAKVMPGDDVRLSAWCLLEGVPKYSTAPSLVEHLGLPTVMNKRNVPGRHARVFADNTTVDVSQGWDTPILRVAPTLPGDEPWDRVLLPRWLDYYRSKGLINA